MPVPERRDAMCDNCRPIVQICGALMLLFGVIALFEMFAIFSLHDQRDDARKAEATMRTERDAYASVLQARHHEHCQAFADGTVFCDRPDGAGEKVR